MSRIPINRHRVARMLCRPVLMALMVVATVAMTASVANAAPPVIRQVLGIDHGAKVNGKVNITARVAGEPDQVVLALSGPLNRTSVRTEAPYFFLSNKQGNPRYWNTLNAPEGAYTMRVKAIKDGQVVDSVAVQFTVDRSAPKQQSIPQKQRLRTELDGGANEVTEATNDAGDAGDAGAGSASSQPVISFASSAPDTFEHGSDEDVDINVNGDMPADADILAIAWDHERKQLIPAFAHTLNNANPLVSSDKLETLPDGRMQIQLLYRENSVVQYRKLHDITVVTDGGAVDIGEEEPDPVVVTDPTQITGVTGISNNQVVSGAVKIEATVSGDTPDELTFTEADAPYVFLGDTKTWDSSKHPNGDYVLTVVTLTDGDQTDTHTINFSVNNEVTIPDPIVAFPSGTPSTYRLGEGIDIPFSVDRELPENATVLVLAWSSATWGMVNEFAHYQDSGPWTISASKLALLQPGRTQLQLLYRVDNTTVYKRTHDLEILAAYGDEPTDSGSNGTVDDEPTNSGSDDQPVDDEPVVDNGGNDGGTSGGNSGGGSGSGGTAGGSDGGDSGTDNGNNEPPTSVVNLDQHPVLGMNLSFVTYWTREWVFTNVMRQGKGWTPTNTGGKTWDTGENINTDSNGWPILNPGQAAATIILNATDGRYPGGKYICTYEGDGDIVFDWDAKATSHQSGRIEVQVTPSDRGIYLRIENSNPSDHIRNIKLVHEDLVDHPSSFHPLFVERLRPFKTLRFMDWQRTNTTSQVNWSDRVTPDYYTQAERGGVAIELLIELANELGADPWVCMPAHANDDYVRRFAQLVKNNLHADGKVYVEWSNEVWNSQFEIHKWIKENTDGQSLSMPFFDKWAAEARRDFAIWSDVWSNDSDRMVRVAAAQAALSWGTGKLLERMNGQFDAISCSTYFGLRSHEENAMSSSTSVQEIIDILEENIVTDNRQYYTEHGQLAREYSQSLGRPIRLIAYEGGQHLADGGRNKPHKAQLIAAQDHPKMYDLYQQNMFEFERAGGSANVMFNYVGRRDQWGSWGHLQYQDEPVSSAPKFKAMLDYPGSQKRLELTTFD